MGKKFPDLSGDGKVTQKDILMGRGVIPRTKKQKGGALVNKKKRVMKRGSGGLKAAADKLKRAKLAGGGMKKRAKMAGGGMKKRAKMAGGGMKKRAKLMGGGMKKRVMKRGGGMMKKGK